MKKRRIQYCSLEPDFPKKAYLCYLFLSGGQQIIKIFPLRAVGRSLDEITDGIKEIVDKTDVKNSRAKIENKTILIPIQFHSLLPLKKEYWERPTYHISEEERYAAFIKAYNNYQFYKVLIVPYSYKRGKWNFANVLPFLLNTDKKTVEGFMFTIDEAVERRAKYAAFYTLSKPVRYDWVRKKLDDPDRENVLIN